MIITSAANRQIKELHALVRKRKERTRTGLFTAEGIKLFQETPEDLREAVYVSETFEKENKDLLRGTDYFVAADHLFEKICDTKTPQGIISVIRQPRYRREDLLGNGKPFIVFMENIRDPGNAGTIMRTAEGAGVSGLILTKGSVDIFSPKTIRSTMGSVFRVPFIYEDDIKSLTAWFKENGITSYGAHLSGECLYTKPDYTSGRVLFIGNEANGLSSLVISECDMLVNIPMEGRLESLNAAAAAAILMYTVHEKRNHERK